MGKPKLLLYDIEVFAHSAKVWVKYEADVLKFLQYGSIASISYRWLGEEKIHCISRRTMSEKQLLKAFQKTASQATHTLAHNGDSFDKKLLNAYYVRKGLKPHTPTIDLDTKKIAKKHFRFPGNSLNDLADYLGIGRKTKHTGYDMWDECEKNDKAAWKLMETYNKNDVELLTKVYERLKPWIYRQPGISLAQEKSGCQNGCYGKLLKEGKRKNASGIEMQQLRCSTCGAWSSEKVHSRSLG